MAFEIDEEKLKSVDTKKSFITKKEFDFAGFFLGIFAGFSKIIITFFTVLVVGGLIIFIGGAILGILLFGWRQL